MGYSAKGFLLSIVGMSEGKGKFITLVGYQL